MSLISNVPPNGGAGVALANVVPVAVAQANGAAGTSATARLMLPTAVIAPSLVPAYAEKPKTITSLAEKPIIRQPSSALAAQLLAQTPDVSPETLEIFAKQAPVAANGALPNQPLANLNQQPAAAPVPSVAAQVASITTAKVPANENQPAQAAAPLPKRVAQQARMAHAYEATIHTVNTNLMARAVKAVI